MASLDHLDIFDQDPYGLRGAGKTGNRGTSAPTVKPYRTPPYGPDPSTSGNQAPGGGATGSGASDVPSFPGVLPGWDAAKWGNTGYSSPKYDIGRILAGYDPTVSGLQQALSAIQAKYPGTTLQGLDKLQIPNVGLVDVLQNAKAGGTGWWWGSMTDAAGNPIGGSASGVGASGGGGTSSAPSGGSGLNAGSLDSLFSDPAGRLAMDAVQQRLAQLTGAPPAEVARLLGLLGGRVGEAMPGNEQLGQFLSRTNERIGQLQSDPFSDSEEASMRAAAFDQIERDRTVAKQRLLEELGSRGHSPTDGTVIRAMQQVDQHFDSLRAQQTSQMALYQMTERQNRLNQAQTLSGLLQQAGAAQQGQAINWSQADFARALQALAANTGLWDQTMGYGGQALAASMVPESMLQGRFNMLNAASGGGDPMGAIGGYTGLANLIQQQQAQRQQYWAQMMSQLAPLLTNLINVWT